MSDRAGCTLSEADVIDPETTLDREDETVTAKWPCGVQATTGSHGWKRYDDDDVIAMHRYAHERATR